MPPIDAGRNELRELTITITIEVLTEKKAVCSNVVPEQARVLSMLPINSPLLISLDKLECS
jgi:hypothetical protein